MFQADDLIKAEMARLVAWDVQNNVPNEVYEENDLKAASELIKSVNPMYSFEFM